MNNFDLAKTTYPNLIPEEDGLLLLDERNQIEYHGPWCSICGTHMGNYYERASEYIGRNHGKWGSEKDYQDYGEIKCSKCGQKYYYTEDHCMDLTEEQMEVLRVHKEKQLAKEGKVATK